jgi:CubicO group peptidase (beta-lactamase class C family)
VKAVALLAGVLLVSASAPQRVSNPAPSAAEVAIDEVVHKVMQSRRIPGVAIAVVDDGRIVVQRAYGFANLETDTPVAVNSIFEIASLTKQFTAVAIMMLVEEGKVRLDNPLSTYVQPVPPSWERISIRHLLTHTSGLGVSAMPRVDGVAARRPSGMAVRRVVTSCAS